MFSAIRRWLLGSPAEFDPAWERVLLDGFDHWRLLDHAELDRMRELVALFVATNEWEAAKGMDLTEDVQVLIAAQACMLLLGLEIDEYFDVTSIIVHRSTVVRQAPTVSPPGSSLIPHRQHFSGLAVPKGPVVLSWNAVTRGARNPGRGQNVVYHEFAHRLDMLDGITDGTPPLGSDEADQRWRDVFTPAFERVRNDESVLRKYAAKNTAEFFAVATEAFFNTPHDLRDHEPDLYSQLRMFYGQDPAGRVPR